MYHLVGSIFQTWCLLCYQCSESELEKYVSFCKIFRVCFQKIYWISFMLWWFSFKFFKHITRNNKRPTETLTKRSAKIFRIGRIGDMFIKISLKLTRLEDKKFEDHNRNSENQIILYHLKTCTESCRTP